jgi:branched-chain amino acid transport system substrate-binding protein
VIRIALLSPNSGELATFGRMMRNGTILALEQQNESGGVMGRRLAWAIYDTNCDFELAHQATQQAIDDGFQFIIGPLCSEAAIAAAQLADSARVLLISPTGTHPLVTVDNSGRTRPTIFRTGFASPFQGRAAACFAYEHLQATKAAVLSNPNDDYARGLAVAFNEQFSLLGGQITHQATYNPGTIDFTETLLTINNSMASIIYLPAQADTVNRVAGQLNELGLARASASGQQLLLLGGDSWESDSLDRQATAGSYFTTHFALAGQPARVQSWAKTYKANYAIEPNTLAALGYDAGLLLVEALARAGTPDPITIAQELEQGEFVGVTGQISFDHQHNPIKPVPVLSIESGQTRLAAFIQIEPQTRNCTIFIPATTTE